MKTLEKHLTEVDTRLVDDSDLYKFTMMWAVMDHFPSAWVRYEFFCRNDKNTGLPRKFPPNFASNLRKRIQNQSGIHLTPERIELIRKKCPYLPAMFLDFLKGYRFDTSELSISQNGTELQINIEGYWYRTILWEVFLMSEISELYYLMTEAKSTVSDSKLIEINNAKGSALKFNNVKFVEFGTRRRYSLDNHISVLQSLKKYGGVNCVGTSNLAMAIDFDLKAIGTYAHEWVSGVASIMGYRHANKHAMELWSQTYGGSLGIALTDTFGLDAFLKDFDLKYAKLFDGVRHDSGDPFIFADRIIEHYNSLGIDPLQSNKSIVFSDGLDVETAIKLSDYCRGKIHTSFGIGTHFTNDIPGVDPLNIVIKLFLLNGSPTIKLSDIPNKHTGDSETIEIVKKYINYKPLS